jgi:demethylmenaquinone methyltransferase/2-methoxy-6-polyprenyl-1,4-benzoquinol methylase
VNYDLVAPIYDSLAMLWTGGAIDAARRWAPASVRSGDRVLFAGVGSGRDAAEATRRGGLVTGVDLSARMLRAASIRCGAGFLPLQQDVRDHDPDDGYDLVCAHYFLNVFGEVSMPDLFDRLAGFVRPGGRLSIADFSPRGGGLLGLLQAFHYRVPATAFRLLGMCEDHAIHDYSPLLETAGFDVVVRDFPIFGVGPRWHRSWLGTRRA